MLIAVALTAAVIGAAATLTAQTILRRLNPEPTCTTCGNHSGHRVTGHTDRQCRAFVQEQRRRTTAHAAATGAPAPTLPDAYGHSWPFGH